MSDSAFCSNCGTKIEPMKYCINCGKPLPNDTKFCNDCEQKVFRRIFCINCGTELKEEQKFCTNCGFSAVSSQKANETLQQPNDEEFNKPIPVQEEIGQPQTEQQSAEGDTEKKHQIETVACHNEDNNSSKNDKPNTKTKSLTLLWLYAIGGFLLFGLGLGLLIIEFFDLSVVEFDSKRQSKMLSKALICVVAGCVIAIKYIREIYKFKKINNENASTPIKDSNQVLHKKSSKLPLIIGLTLFLLGGGFLAYFYLFSPNYQEDDIYCDSIDNSDNSEIPTNYSETSNTQISPTWKSDKGLFQVQGPVKKISGYLDANVSELITGSFVEFDENGKCINLSSSSSFRENNGFINPQDPPGSSFEYNDQGFLSSYYIAGASCGTTCNYEYNNHNLLVNYKEIMYGHYINMETGEEVPTEEILSSYSFHNHIVDHHGNWTVRVVLDDNSGGNDFSIQKRYIEYWDGTKSGFKPSSDLAFFGVKGPVERIKGDLFELSYYVYSSGAEKPYAEFDKDGQCLNLKPGMKIDGVISVCERMPDGISTFEYNEFGLSKSVHSSFDNRPSVTLYIYTKDGLLIEESTKGESFSHSTKYKYTQFDDWGNWTERIATNSKSRDEVQTRIITYFSENKDISDNKEVPVYSAVEQMPEFPGGEEELMKYISRNIKYPTMAMENNIQGRVVVQFVVTKTGKIGEVKVVRSKDPDLDKEAVRVVKSLPNFIPGKMNGQAVNVWYTLPITFNIEETQ